MYDLANGRDLRGVGLWALGYEGDALGLYQLQRDKFGVPVAPTGAPSHLLSAVPPAERLPSLKSAEGGTRLSR